MAVQAALGSDIAMAFDECPPSDAPPAVVARRGGAHHPLGPALPGGAGGARAAALRHRAGRGGRAACAARTWRRSPPLPFEGVALGGLGVGEPPPVMHEVVAAVAPRMPADRPRYLMGVGRPEDLLAGIASRHRHVRLRDAHPQRAQRPAVHPPGQAEHRQQRAPRGRRARSRTTAPARPAASTAAPTWRTCSGPRSCCTTAWPPSTTCSTTWIWRGRRALAIQGGWRSSPSGSRCSPKARSIRRWPCWPVSVLEQWHGQARGCGSLRMRRGRRQRDPGGGPDAADPRAGRGAGDSAPRPTWPRRGCSTTSRARRRPMPSPRQALAEAARIARGPVRALSELRIDEIDALIFPGGEGVATVLSNYADKGAGVRRRSRRRPAAEGGAGPPPADGVHLPGADPGGAGAGAGGRRAGDAGAARDRARQTRGGDGRRRAPLQRQRHLRRQQDAGDLHARRTCTRTPG